MTEEARRQDKFFCDWCHYILDKSEIAKNIDGTDSRLCKDCKCEERDAGKKRYQKLKGIYRSIQREKIDEMGCSCNICKVIILKHETEDSRQVRKLHTYLKEGLRYVDYEGQTYLKSDFISKFSSLLEYRTLDLDHLTEKELRERGILKPGEEYLGKQNDVSSISNGHDMRKEAVVTQQACVECHTRVGVSREGGRHFKYDEDKLAYVNNRRKQGCICCGFYDPNLLKFLEFNHRNPPEKIENISIMAKDKKYSYEQLVTEGEKTDVICRSCHRIETSIQIQKGIILIGWDRFLAYSQEDEEF